MVHPNMVNDTVGLQGYINRLFRKGKNGQTLYIADRVNDFLIRVIKIKRKTMADTLKAEIRAADKNTNGYIIAKDILISVHPETRKIQCLLRPKNLEVLLIE